VNNIGPWLNGVSLDVCNRAAVIYLLLLKDGSVVTNGGDDASVRASILHGELLGRTYEDQYTCIVIYHIIIMYLLLTQVTTHSPLKVLRLFNDLTL